MSFTLQAECVQVRNDEVAFLCVLRHVEPRAGLRKPLPTPTVQAYLRGAHADTPYVLEAAYAVSAWRGYPPEYDARDDAIWWHLNLVQMDSTGVRYAFSHADGSTLIINNWPFARTDCHAHIIDAPWHVEIKRAHQN